MSEGSSQGWYTPFDLWSPLSFWSCKGRWRLLVVQKSASPIGEMPTWACNEDHQLCRLCLKQIKKYSSWHSSGNNVVSLKYFIANRLILNVLKLICRLYLKQNKQRYEFETNILFHLVLVFIFDHHKIMLIYRMHESIYLRKVFLWSLYVFNFVRFVQLSQPNELKESYKIKHSGTS